MALKKQSFSKPQLIIFALVFAAIGGAIIWRSFAAGTSPDGTWENGMGTFSNLECVHPDTQFARVTNPVAQGSYAAMFHETANDVWSNSIVRCLAADYSTGETTGDDFYYHLSVYIPSPGLSSNLIWELHHPSSLYNTNGCWVAPFAIVSNGTGLDFRISTGNCTVGQGYANWQPHIPMPNLATQPQNTWIQFAIHIKFAETNTGTVEVYDKIGSGSWSKQIGQTNISTMPYADSLNVHNVKLYTEMGLYAGSTSYSGVDTVYLDDYRRETSLAAAQGSSTPGNPPPTVTLTASPASITSGSSSTLSWSSTNATSCTASGAWSGSMAISGSQSVSPSSTSTYGLNCTGAGGTASANTTVTVTAASNPLTVTSSSINNGDTVANGTTWTATFSQTPSLVEFWANGSKLSQTSTAPYSTVINLPAGSNQLGLCGTLNGTRTCFGTGGVFATVTVTTSTAKLGDLDGSGTVDVTDLSMLLTRFGTTDPVADIDKSGKVDVTDLSILLSHYGT